MSEREELVKSLHELYNQLQADGWQYYSLRGNGLHTISRAIAFLSSQEDVRDGGPGFTLSEMEEDGGKGAKNSNSTRRKEVMSERAELLRQLKAWVTIAKSIDVTAMKMPVASIEAAIASLSSQEDVRDGVLEEAAFYHDDKAAEYEVQARLAERPGAELKRAMALRVAAEHQQYAADIRALKSKPAERCQTCHDTGKVYLCGVKDPVRCPTCKTAEKCEHEEGDSEYGGRGTCVKCGREYTTPQPTQEAPTLVEEWRSRLKIASGTRLLRVDGNDLEELLDAVESYIDRRLAERA